MILFQLWREYKLSVAEILSVFPKITIEFVSKDVLIVSDITSDLVVSLAHKLGGTIKIWAQIEGTITDEAEKQTWKFQYGISLFWGKSDLKKILIWHKKELKACEISSRFVNKDFTNLSSAQIIGQWLIENGNDFSIVNNKWEKSIFKTIWIQDIEGYAKRDYSKSRDMQVGMLPPKLSQMLINFSGGKAVYDPFVWLGTILIESVYMWNKLVYGSDLSEGMVETSSDNLQKLQKVKSFSYKIEKLNAKFVEEFEYIKKTDVIVTEWYLWEMMTMKNISVERIEKQKDSLEKIYQGFFASLKNIAYKGNIVICFPFWEISWNFIYADNLYEILAKYTHISEIIPWDKVCEEYSDFLSHSKSWSLLYKRHNQIVGREIFKLTIK